MNNITHGSEPDITQDLDRMRQSAVIMMVDDEPILMDTIRIFLEEEGYQTILTVEDSRKAVEVLNETRPDVLFLDLMMPEVDGFTILTEIRADARYRFLPVIVLTSSSDSATKLRALELGATDFLAKPVDPSELILRMRNTLIVKSYQDQLAYYDPVTGLPNRRLFMDKVEWGIQRNFRENKPLAVMTVGLDRFRQLNERLGPNAGDELLAEFASRLKSAVRKEDVVSVEEFSRGIARLGGGDFAVLLSEIDRASSAAFVARRIFDSIRDPFVSDGQEIKLSACVGIAVCPTDGNDTDTLVKNSTVALEQAKVQGHGTVQFYSSKVDAQSRDLFRLESDLRRALQDNEFELFYQPKIEARSGQVVGTESLLRWNSHERGMVPPDVFIPVTEETGLIIEIGEWLILEACRETKALQTKGFDNLQVSVNVSALQIADKNLYSTIESALSKSGLNPSGLIIEITESILMSDVEQNISVLHAIKDLGVSLSIDDFGTGYSSLSYLKQLPVEELKIDKSFVNDIPHNTDDVSIIKAIIALAHTLGLSVAAEGVERTEQLDFLKTNDCDMLQGYHFSKPLSSKELEAYLNVSMGLEKTVS